MKILYAMRGNPIFVDASPESRAEYTKTNDRLAVTIPNVQSVILNSASVKVTFTEGTRVIKYPKSGATLEWLVTKVGTLGEQVKEKYLWSKLPLSVQRFCKQAETLQREGGTVTREGSEYVVRYGESFTSRMVITMYTSNIVTEFMDKLCAETSELQRLKRLAEKYGLL
nr:MAG TPA: hypothetical protein [Caudoviricetes sp.]